MGASASPESESLRHRLGTILRFPLRPWLRPLILGAALIVALVSLLLPRLSPIFAGLLSLLTMITLWVLALRVATRLLIATAEGAGLEREYRAVDLAEFQALRQVGLWLFTALILAAMLQSFGVIGLLLGLLAAIVLLPGMTLLLATDNQFYSLWQRQRWRAVLELLGKETYLELCNLLAVFALVYLALDRLTSAGLPTFLSNGLMTAFWVYLLWAGFYALGRALQKSQAKRAAALEAAPPEESLERLGQRLIESGGSLEDHRRLFRALEQAGDHEALLERGPGFIAALLLAYDRPPEAVEKAATLVSLDPGFHLGVPSAHLALIQAARRHGYPELVADLAASYLSTWPVAPGGLEVRLTACEALASWPEERASRWFGELSNVELPAALRPRYQALTEVYRRR